jgi:glycosyltransferase involved in cell wall biosynthesis
MVLPPVFPVVRSIHDFVARGKRPSSNRPLRLITVRRLVRRVGVDLLIEAVRLLIERHKLDVSLVIVGEGPERPFLEQLAKSAPSTRQHVTFTGRLNDDDRNFELSKSDLFVIPTRKCEGFGMAILEATAAGIPVVGTPIDAIPEVLESVGMGHLVARAPTGEALANTIAAYWKEDQSLDWSEVYQRMDKFYSGKETASRLSLVLRDQAQDPDAKLALSTGI